jgi:SAM-dependent methyltransferase
MVARATVKARRAGLQLNILNATAQQLPYKNGEFDVVLSTLMFHHLPKTGRAEFAREAFRVLKSGGRVIIDFAKPPRQKRGFRRTHRPGQGRSRNRTERIHGRRARRRRDPETSLPDRQTRPRSPASAPLLEVDQGIWSSDRQRTDARPPQETGCGTTSMVLKRKFNGLDNA